MTEPLIVLIAEEPDHDDRDERIEANSIDASQITVNEIGLRERAMTLASRFDADLADVPTGRFEMHALQRLARRLMQLAPEVRIVREDAGPTGPTVTTSEGLKFGVTPSGFELVLLGFHCPRPRHEGVVVNAYELVRDVLELGRYLNRHERYCARLDKLARDRGVL